MAEIYKSPLQQAIALKGQRDGTPEYNKEVLLDFLTQYGDSVTDDAYEEWALKKGKQLGPRQNNALGETRFGDYINDDEWLQEAWGELYPEAIEYSDHLNQNPKEARSIRSWRGYNKGGK